MTSPNWSVPVKIRSNTGKSSANSTSTAPLFPRMPALRRLSAAGVSLVIAKPPAFEPGVCVRPPRPWRDVFLGPEEIGDRRLQCGRNVVDVACRDPAQAVLVFVRLLKNDADDLGQLLLRHADPQTPFADAVRNAKIDDPSKFGRHAPPPGAAPSKVLPACEPLPASTMIRAFAGPLPAARSRSCGEARPWPSLENLPQSVHDAKRHRRTDHHQQ